MTSVGRFDLEQRVAVRLRCKKKRGYEELQCRCHPHRDSDQQKRTVLWLSGVVVYRMKRKGPMTEP